MFFFISLFLQLLSFLQGLFTFYHEGYELAQEFAPYKQQLQFNLQNVRLYLFSLSPLSESDAHRATELEPRQTLESVKTLFKSSKTSLI